MKKVGLFVCLSLLTLALPDSADGQSVEENRIVIPFNIQEIGYGEDVNGAATEALKGAIGELQQLLPDVADVHGVGLGDIYVEITSSEPILDPLIIKGNEVGCTWNLGGNIYVYVPWPPTFPPWY